ncbi:Hypothetical protein CINCED_3A008527 [Cinara cedri]|uniref:Uncharacterized protein n=1 Tax=Cinara cedri TaxID=506608 RepID=A0A5E4MR93_9HEMI|nr:Hypothetical protein CINCED_3A008527 [Cinara cedri]
MYLVTILLCEWTQELKTGRLTLVFHNFDYSKGEAGLLYIYICSFVLTKMYFERLEASNSNYLKFINPSELFFISMLVVTKYLYDAVEYYWAVNREWDVILESARNKLETHEEINYQNMIKRKSHKLPKFELYGSQLKSKSGHFKIAAKGSKKNNKLAFYCCRMDSHFKPNCEFKTYSCSNCSKISHLKKVFKNKTEHVNNVDLVDLNLSNICNLDSDVSNSVIHFYVKLCISKKPRVLPFFLKDSVSKVLDRLIAVDLLLPVEARDWGTPIVLVVKANGSIRICSD